MIKPELLRRPCVHFRLGDILASRSWWWIFPWYYASLAINLLAVFEQRTTYGASAYASKIGLTSLTTCEKSYSVGVVVWSGFPAKIVPLAGEV
jgi:hypothetical protein